MAHTIITPDFTPAKQIIGASPSLLMHVRHGVFMATRSRNRLTLCFAIYLLYDKASMRFVVYIICWAP